MASGTLLPPVATAPARPRPTQAEVDEEDCWLKKIVSSVSLPSLHRGPRPRMWELAEGADEDLDAEGEPCNSNGRARRASFASQPEELSARDAELDSAAKASGYCDKRKQLKQVDLYAKQLSHADKHRQLKQMFREERQLGRGDGRSLCSNYAANTKRGGVKETPSRRKMIDQQKTEQSIKQIQGHLHGCSHARHELMEMQRTMSKMAGNMDLAGRASFTDLKAAFGSALHKHDADEF